MSADITISEQTHVVHAPTSIGDEYLHKRHTSEGSHRRRNSRARTMPPELRNLTDAELDDRNARVWASVQRGCQIAAGVRPDSHPRLYSGNMEGTAYRVAQRAALRICFTRYGIPFPRLADLCESQRQNVGKVCRAVDHAADDLARVWETSQGPAMVERSDLVVCYLTIEARDALLTLALDCDDAAAAKAGRLAARDIRV
jgi:hypothetical protein